MKRFIKAVAIIIAAALTLTACGAQTDNDNAIETPIDSSPTNEMKVVDEYEQPNEAKHGNTSGNITNNAFTAQNGDDIYYILPTNSGTELHSGNLIKTNTDGGEKAVLLSGNKPLCLNIADGWIYYISSLDGLIFKIREDGTENTLITSADTQSGFMQGYTTQNLSMAELMVVVDNYIYCRVFNPDHTKDIYKINIDSGEVEQLLKLSGLTSGFAVYDDWIYYSKFEDEVWETYKIRTDGTENIKIADINLYSISIANNKIYYICADETSKTQIYSMDLDGSNNGPVAEGVTAVRINVVGDWIYYTDTSAIYKMKTDGTEKAKLCDFASSNFINMNVLDDWIYLTGTGFNMQKLRTDGSQLQEVKE